MNANELADELHKIYIQEAAECWDVVEEAATMLRQQQEKLTKYELRHVAQRDRIAILEMQHKQQQAEIEALKKEAALQKLSDFTQEADNEPVAWMTENGYLITKDENLANIIKEKGEEPIIPLYTHPAKTLTDEEIYEVWKKAMQEEAKIEYSIYATQLERQPFLYFARAILRKAQEK